MSKNMGFAFLLLLIGMSSGLWINMGAEYMPGELITIGVSDAEGVLVVDVYDGSGSSVFHEVRAVEREGDEDDYWYYTYEDFELTLPSGEYRVVVKDDSEQEEREFRVSSIGIMAIVGPDGKGMFMHKGDGSPIEGAEMTLTYNLSGVISEEETVSGVNGIFHFDSNGLIGIRGEYGEESAEVRIYSYYYEPYWWYGDRYSTYAFSDKTLYQPGETVHISSVIFKDNGTAYETVLGEFDVEIRGPEYDTVYSNTISAVNSRVSFDYELGEEAALGWYSVQIRRNDSYAGWYNFEVQEYKRPEIEVKLEPWDEVFAVNETIYVNVSTDYYFGGTADAEVKFEIYRGPHYIPYYRAYYCYCPWWAEELVAEGLIYTEDGVGVIEWDGTNVTGDYRVKVYVTDESEVVTEEEVVVSVLKPVNLDALVPTMQVNQTGTITIIAYDEDGVPLDLDGSLKIYSGDNYYYWNWKKWVENATPVFEMGFSTLDGKFGFEFTPESYGSHFILLEADGAKARQYFYVSEWSWWNWDYLEVELDKEEYAEGEAIGLTVTSPLAGRLLVVSMGSGAEIEFLEVEPGINELELDADETSNLRLYVIEEGTKYAGYGNYMVRGDNWIEIDVEHGEVYEPGSVARLVINAEKAGSRSNAAAAIAVVDQAIIDLSGAEWRDIYKYFYGYPEADHRVVFSWDDYYYRYGGLVYADGIVEEAEALPAAAPEEQKTLEEIRIRERFIETALWIPYIVLENGKKEIIWHIPDTLTRWNITVIANEGTDVGMGSSSVVVTKDVIGRFSPPVGLVEDDSAAIPVTVFNYGEERDTFKVTLKGSSNLLMIGSPIRYVSLEAGESHTYFIPVKALDAGPGNLTLWVEGGEGDAMRLPMDVKPFGIEVVEGQSGSAEEKGADVSYESPADAEVTLALHSSILSSAFESLDYLVNYPYGCIEQTMSGFLPDVVLLYAMDELGIEYTGEENVTALVQEGLEMIYEHQNSDGSWGWFRGTDGRITAYVMDGLRIAKKAGVEVDGEVYSDGLEALKELNGSYPQFVLNRIDSSLVRDYANDSFGALAECDDGKCERLVSMLDCSGDYCRLEYQRGKSWWWYHSDTELTSYAVETLVKAGDVENAQKCVNWLMIHKTGRYWRSTKDTARTVLALVEYAKETGELRSDYVATVYLDGEKIYEGRMGHTSVSSEELELPAGEHSLRIERDGFGPLYYTLTEVYYTDVIPEGEISVVREYSQTVAKVGDEIEVTLHINGTGQYVAVEDPIPLGTEIIQEEPGRWWWYYGGYRMEAREDKAVFFFDRLDDTTLTYKVRVTHKGDFTALPTHAFNMYAPEVSGYSDFEHFTFYEKAYIEPYMTEYNTTLTVWWDGPEPALLRVTVDGVEREYEVLPGENTVVVPAGELSYVFESEEEYFEVESDSVEPVEPEEEEPEESGGLMMLVIITALGAVVLLYFWKGR